MFFRRCAHTFLQCCESHISGQNSKALHVVICYGLKLSFVNNNFVFNEVVNILHLIFGLVVKKFAFGSIHGFINKAIIMYI